MASALTFRSVAANAAALFACDLLPVILSTCLPGLLVAEILSPNLKVEGVWTYVAACAIIAVLLMAIGQLRALRWLRAFLRPPAKGTATGSG